MLRGIVISSALLGLTGCNVSDYATETWYKGSIKGYNVCKKAGLAEGLSLSAVLPICTARHQHPVVAYLSGTGGYYSFLDSPVYFSGRVTNDSKDKIVTTYSVSVRHNKSSTPELKTFSGVWIEPGESVNFAIGNEELKFKPTEDLRGSDYFTWNTASPQGINIDF